MESRAKILGHPAHQMLIPFPFGLLATAAVFDIIYLFTGDAATSDQMALVAFWMIAAGIVGGLAAAPFGVIDYLAIPKGTRARFIGMTHGLGNVVVLLLFAASLWLRYTAPAVALTRRPTTAALALSFAGFALAGLTGWLGGELVDRLGVGVDDGAHLDAPNSLSGRPASEKAAAPGRAV
ncbi:MAG TPA: DUF2231 domain-containing protein [Pyrinomonadaceae bacterium]|nr:DUF2231 domain-containing protein [Pyrinomonadaceae bacterium]